MTNDIKQDQVVGNIYLSNDYSKFHFLKGNRSISETHVRNLVRSISEVDRTKENPISVDSEFGIHDGQHRFLAVQKLNKPVFYSFTDGETDLRTIQLLNAVKKNWFFENYLNSFIEQGYEDYKVVKEFSKEYGISPTNTIAVLNIDHDVKVLHAPYTAFKTGNFEVRNMAMSKDFIGFYIAIKGKLSGRSHKDRTFLKALYKVYRNEAIDVDIFSNRILNNASSIYREVDDKGYLRKFEDIYNQNLSKANQVRFF